MTKPVFKTPKFVKDLIELYLVVFGQTDETLINAFDFIQGITRPYKYPLFILRAFCTKVHCWRLLIALHCSF